MAAIQSHREMKSRTLEYPNLLQSSCLHHCHLLLPTIHKFHEVLFYGAQVLPSFFLPSLCRFLLARVMWQLLACWRQKEEKGGDCPLLGLISVLISPL